MTGFPSGRGRRPSPAERALWARAVADTVPLAGRPPPLLPVVAPPAPAPPPEPPKARSLPAAPAVRREPRPVALDANQPVAGLDRRTTERLRRGQLPIEARLDLHGLTQAEAHEAVDRFIAEADRAGRRAVLIITGKGGTRRGEDGMPPWLDPGSGVLRRAVPRWLMEAPNRARVLAITTARPDHGGEGALYVLIRRRRA